MAKRLSAHEEMKRYTEAVNEGRIQPVTIHHGIRGDWTQADSTMYNTKLRQYINRGAQIEK